MASGRLAKARLAMRVWRNSLFPDPVVPATRACGPSRRRSMPNAPAVVAPTTAAVVRPAAFHDATTASADGGSMPRRSRRRSEVGSTAASSVRRLRRTGESARATCSPHSGATRSASMSEIGASRVARSTQRVGSSGEKTAVVRHSSGRRRSDSSRAIVTTPTSGPRRSSLVTAG